VASRGHAGKTGHLTVGGITGYKRHVVECVQAFSRRSRTSDSSFKA
jgi:hypothetical protein